MSGTSRIGILLLLLLAGWVVLYYLLFSPIAREEDQRDGGLSILDTDSVGANPERAEGLPPVRRVPSSGDNAAPPDDQAAVRSPRNDQPGPAPDADVARPPDAEPVIPPPPPTTAYEVRRGDTMESIAAEWFGSKAKWVLIAYENPLVDPMKLKAGITLRLPPRGARVEGIPTEELRRLTRSTKYVVVDGDSLWKIAARVYGNGSLHTLIAEANRDVLGSSTDLQIGMELVIPPYQKPAD